MNDNSAYSSRLRDHPNWGYLLHELLTLYRYGSPGGSQAIRAHRKKVRDLLSSLIASNPEVEQRQPEIRPVVAHLDRAFDLGHRGMMAPLSRALERVAPEFSWEYGYEKVPKGLAAKYAFCDILGPKGPVLSNRLTMGLVLFAPNTTYPQHAHSDIEESYISIAGAWSENQIAVFAPGSLILNVPGHEHRITTGEIDPCLLAYAWVGAEERLAAPGMKFSRTRKPAS